MNRDFTKSAAAAVFVLVLWTVVVFFRERREVPLRIVFPFPLDQIEGYSVLTANPGIGHVVRQYVSPDDSFLEEVSPDGKSVSLRHRTGIFPSRRASKQCLLQIRSDIGNMEAGGSGKPSETENP